MSDTSDIPDLGYAKPCVVCGTALRNCDAASPGGNQPYGGTTFESFGHYGSTVFDPMDGQYLELNICDDCLTNARNNQEVLLGRRWRLVVVTDDTIAYPMPTVVGRVKTPEEDLVEWTVDNSDSDTSDQLMITVETMLSGELDDVVEWQPGIKDLYRTS